MDANHKMAAMLAISYVFAEKAFIELKEATCNQSIKPILLLTNTISLIKWVVYF